MNGIQKIISGCLALCLVLSMLPMQVLAEEAIVTESVREDAAPGNEDTVAEPTTETEEDTAPPVNETEAMTEEVIQYAPAMAAKKISFDSEYSGAIGGQLGDHSSKEYQFTVSEACEIQIELTARQWLDNQLEITLGSKSPKEKIVNERGGYYQYRYYISYVLGSGTYTLEIDNNNYSHAVEYYFTITKYAHTHDYTYSVTNIAASCTEGGYTKCKCRCGDTVKITDGTTALGHNEVKTAAELPTCTKEGKTEGTKCSRCGKVMVKPESVPTVPHTLVKVPGSAATCTEQGTIENRCSVCDTLVSTDAIPVLGHEYQYRFCKRCKQPDKDTYLGYGSCGNPVYWFLEVDGTLVILGEGDMSSGMLFRDEAVAAQVQKVVINHGVTRIGWDAFTGCINLTSVSIPDSVTEIQSLVFLDCNKLTSITIPAGVTDIWENAFNGCQSLRRIDVDSKNTAYSSNQGVLFNKTQTKLIRVPEGYTGSYTVPYGVTEVGSNAFLACKGLTEITFTGKAPKIESNSFYATSTTVYYPKGDASWNSVITSNYGGTITWKAKNVPVHQHTYSNNVDGTCNGCGIHRENVETRQVTHMFRMYNPNTGEHFYTGSEVEKSNLVTAGWHYEGVGFTFPANTGAPVHRLFQPSTGEHLYTMNEGEKASLMAKGWNYEGIAFNSAYDTEAVQHRLHNPNATVGAYHFTFSDVERQNLINAGWEYQGIGWYSCWK